MEFEENLRKTSIDGAAVYLDPKYSADDVAAVAGMQLELLEMSVKSGEVPAYMSVGVALEEASKDGKKRFKDFIMSLLSKLRKKICVWWEKNKEKTGTQLMGFLTPLIGDVLGKILGLLAAIVAVFLIKKGIDWLCKGALPKSI